MESQNKNWGTSPEDGDLLIIMALTFQNLAMGEGWC